MTTDKTQRKERPLARGLLDYFPLALAEVAHCSYVGNRQHNPGEELHWAREKSKDHADCILRHMVDRGKADTDGVRHSAKVAWRALAQLQLELEAAQAVQPEQPEQPAESFCEMFTDALRTLGCPDSVATCILGGTSTGADRRGVYIAGPMRGHEDFNFPAFDRARDRLLGEGWTVVNPADIDRFAGDTNPSTGKAAADDRDYAHRDVMALLALARLPGSAIALLPGWQDSKGARAEYALAEWLGLSFILLAPSENP